MERFRKIEAKRSKMHPGGLKDWVENEKWVDIRRPKKDGGYEPCGRNDTTKGKKPVCVPSNKAKSLDKKEIKNRKRQKARKEREPNPGKKPNTTKYTEQAGGKSNVSNTARFRIVTSDENSKSRSIDTEQNIDMEFLNEDYKITISGNHNISFIGSMIPLSKLQSNQPRFVKVALMGEEDEERTSNLSKYFNDIDAIVEEMTRAITVGSLMSITEMIEPGLTGPGDPFSGKDTSAPDIFKELPDANQDEMTEKEYLRYIRFAVKARNNLYEKAVKNQDAKMAEIALLLRKNNINPFNFGDVSGVVREVLENRMK